MRLDGRYAVAFHVSRVSSTALTNWRTALTSLVAVPLLEVLLVVAIAASVGATSLASVAYAGALVALGTSIINGTVGEIARDRSLGVLQDALTFRPFNTAYWTSKVAIPALVGIIVAATAAVAIFALDAEHDRHQLQTAMALIPLVSLSGSAVAIGVSALSVALRDPYAIANVLTAALPITAGVVLPLALYPGWLAAIAQVLPFTAAATIIWIPDLGGASIAGLVLRELLVGTLWLAMGAAAAGRVVRLLRDGRREDIW